MKIKIIYRLILIALLLNQMQLSAQPGLNGAATVSSSNVNVNSYTYLTSNATAGATSLSVNNSSMIGGNFSTALSAGDLLLIIQMQGASINVSNNSNFGQISNYNNVGQYEFRCVSSVPNSSTIVVSVPLSNNYTANGHVQIVRIPRYSSLNVTAAGSIRPSSWNGNTGGITAIEINGNAIINGTITAVGMGFRGGMVDNNSQSPGANVTVWYSNNSDDGGAKGESIAGYETNEYSTLGVRYGRGAIANGGGGGNSHNAGGGGGANGGVVANWNGRGNPYTGVSGYTNAWNLEGGSFSSSTSSGGGRGGYTYASNNRNALTTAPGNTNWGGDNRLNVGGYGGRPLDYSTGRLFIGGGGGAGDGNNSASNDGGDGGGLVFIICYGNISGSGTINASGEDALNTIGGHNDAPGGGGGGGTIVLAAQGSISNSLSLIARGGNGGDQMISGNESEGPGGGGGGGYIAITSGSPSRNVNGGSYGTSSSTAVTEFTPNGATSGGAGTGNAVFSLGTIIPTIAPTANAGPDLDFCTSTNLSASPAPVGSIGTWSIISGVDGTIVSPNSETSLFYGDSSLIYMLEWSVVNNLCLTRRDTVVINPICMPLSVQLLALNAFWNEEGHAVVQWTAGKMENFSHFVLERSKGDGNWTAIANIEPVSTNGISEYQWIDMNCGFGNSIYRLREVDNDQTFKYSKTVLLEVNPDLNDIVAYPMPVENTLYLSGKSLAGAQIQVLNALGMIVEVQIENLNGTVSIDLANLPNGFYFYQVIKNGQIVGGQSFIREKR